ncbi:MAG: hypothetical protein KZQ66_09020, partial [Candidatus Thiodiazotropha sp. (ex Lucinoma aequizonata)]|nr:hypothetical protein [Candidatus Thiodiazotropha sp. (ex Lucinoma aequizonata)]
IFFVLPFSLPQFKSIVLNQCVHVYWTTSTLFQPHLWIGINLMHRSLKSIGITVFGALLASSLYTAPVESAQSSERTIISFRCAGWFACQFYVQWAGGSWESGSFPVWQTRRFEGPEGVLLFRVTADAIGGAHSMIYTKPPGTYKGSM